MRILVIVPTLNEVANLERNLPPLLADWAEGRERPPTVVVSDGGSTDGTLEAARRLGLEVVSGPPGRGDQLNRGAQRALELGAEVLLFLHVDTRLPSGARQAIREAIDRGAVGGAFPLRFDDPRFRYRLASRLINLRTRLTGAPLGDQGQFVRREIFQTMGGFRPWPILEDLDFIRRLRRQGSTVLLAEPVVTAARRYLQRGLLWTAMRNWWIFGLYFLGVSPHRLARLYRSP
jgi:rSAM/selenodomain-associated transferase 2